MAAHAHTDIIVLGAGPAGLMAAIRARQCGADVLVVERNAAAGRKLLLSGKARCNLTNSCDLDAFLQRFSGNNQFLRDAFKKFFNRDLVRFFEERGLALKTERQQRVFPQTDRSSSVLEVLTEELRRLGVRTLFSARALRINVAAGKALRLELENGQMLSCARLILATGGVSYQATGSTGDGIRMARELGHRIVTLRPGLVGLKTQQDHRPAQGLTLRNIRLHFYSGRKTLDTDVGELLFTDYGISGPLVFSASATVIDWLAESQEVFAGIDLKPGLSHEKLHQRLLREIAAAPRKSLRNLLKGLLALRLVDVCLAATRIAKDKKANQMTQDERHLLVGFLKDFRLRITGSRSMDEAMVTRGGVSLKDIDPRTMASRKQDGLYFCGEMIDVDADTGGFNLQAAFSTGYLAGESAAVSVLREKEIRDKR